jgi:osmotically-inducible protein OsmY
MRGLHSDAAIAGIRLVMNRLVISNSAGRRSDRHIAMDVVACLRSKGPGVSRGIVPIIRMGEVSLLGFVDSDLQRLDAQKAVQCVRGVRNVIDRTVLRAVAPAHAVQLFVDSEPSG